MKKAFRVMLSFVFAGVLTFGLFGCGSSDDAVDTKADTNATQGQTPEQDTSATQEPEPEPAKPLDLTGEWEQANKNSETSYQTATITGDTIEVYWVNTEADTKSLYWAGSYTAPGEAP
jgi:hypothetical protein